MTSKNLAHLLDMLLENLPQFIKTMQKRDIKVTYSKSNLMLADPNTEPHGCKTLIMRIDRRIGTR
eukprot:4957536-Ditylum_brightwellii.AAC.1